MRGRGKGRVAARLLCAAALAALASARRAQAVAATAPPPTRAELDPTAPLEPLPDLGVEWPDMNAPDTRLRRRNAPPASCEPAARPTSRGELRYIVAGRRACGGRRCGRAADGVRRAVGARRPTARRPPTRRRSTAARAPMPSCSPSCCAARAITMPTVEPRIEPARRMLLVVLAAEPGANITSIGRASRPRRRRRRRPRGCATAFAVKAGDPVIAAGRHRRRAALQVALGEAGFALAKIGEQQIEIDHQTHPATLVLPVSPARSRASARSASPASRHSAPGHVGDHRPLQARRPVQAVEGRRSPPRADRHRPGRVRRRPAGAGRTAAARSISTSTWSRRRCARSPASLATAPAKGVRVEASWQHRNFFNPEGALTAARRCRHQEQLAGVAVPPQQFHAARPGAQPAVLGHAPEVRRL